LVVSRIVIAVLDQFRLDRVRKNRNLGPGVSGMPLDSDRTASGASIANLTIHNAAPRFIFCANQNRSNLTGILKYAGFVWRGRVS
jgi:hypothetical protein